MKQLYIISFLLFLIGFYGCYDDEGNLLPIETDEEWAMVEEVLGAFGEDEEA